MYPEKKNEQRKAIKISQWKATNTDTQQGHIGALNIGSEAASVCERKTEYTHHTLFFRPFSSDITIKMVRFDVCFSWPFISFGHHKNNQVCFRFCSSCTSIFYIFFFSIVFLGSTTSVLHFHTNFPNEKQQHQHIQFLITIKMKTKMKMENENDHDDDDDCYW